MSCDPQCWSVSPTLFLTRQTNSFPCYATWKSVRMVLGKRVSMELAVFLDLERYSRLWMGWKWPQLTRSFRDKYTALGESVPWDGPEAEFYPWGWKLLIQGASSLLRSFPILSFLLLDPSRVDSLVSEVVLYFYRNRYVWMFPTTEVIFLQVILQMISYWAMGSISPPPLIMLEGIAMLWWDAPWWCHLVYLGKDPRARKTQRR